MHVEFTLHAWLLWIPAIWALLGVATWPLFAYWCSIWISGGDTWADYLFLRRLSWWRRVINTYAWLAVWPFGLLEILPRRYRIWSRR